MFEINTVYQASPDCEAPFRSPARLVGMKGDTAYLMELEKPIKAPFPVPLSVLAEGVREDRIRPDEDFDDGLPVSRAQLSASENKKLDATIKIICSLMEDESLVYDSGRRGKEFARISSESHISIRQVRRLYDKYLWGGQTELALAPLYHLQGGPGKPQNPGTCRRGRPSRNGRELSEVIRYEVLEKLEKGATRFFFTDGEPMDKSYHKTLRYYFKKGYRMGQGRTVEVVLLPEKFLPTYGQFRYTCTQIQMREGLKHTKRRNRMRPEKEEMILTGRARDGVCGPGWRYEIDATGIQVQIVSRYGRHLLVGTPTLYVIIDVWSGAIVGYSLSLEHAGWRLAAKALFNCNQDKGAVFERLELPFTSEDWPSHHLPARLLSDRELANDKVQPVPFIGIKLELTPSMRPDRKGLVEGAINRLKHCNSYRKPGEYHKRPERREPDGKDDASLTLDELERIIVASIIDLNNDPVPEEHIPPEMIEQGETDVSYIGLFKWGLKHRPGHTRMFKDREVYEYLLTRDEAPVTPRGIYFKNQTYTSERLRSGAVRLNDSGKGYPKIGIRYDEHNAGVIWFFDVENKKWVQAVNDDKDVKDLKAAFCELELLQDEKYRLRKASKQKAVSIADDNEKLIAPMVRNAEQEAKEGKEGLSKTQRRKDILGNREIDKLGNRLNEERKLLEDYSGDRKTVTAEPEETSLTIKENQGEPVRDEVINAEPVKPRSISKLSMKLLMGGTTNGNQR